MLQFIRRGGDNAQPIGDLPLWLSAILRNRGIDTPEKADRFLHPSLEHLHDPFLMPGMEKAVRIIREAVAEKAPIVIFDRIRENARKMPGTVARDEVVNKSIKECLGRTINTTLTTLITIVALYILGVSSIKEFALPIIIGIVSGVYSANMINGYVWAALEEKKRKNGGKLLKAKKA